MADEFPKQSPQQITGREAQREFDRQIPSQWSSIPPGDEDFGWDRLVTITSTHNQNSVGDQFFVQVKGSVAVDYVKNFSEVSQQLRVETVNWLLSKPEPSMLAVCDVAQPERPIYWVWIADAVDRLTSKNPDWKKRVLPAGELDIPE